jgi:hypothetical protein
VASFFTRHTVHRYAPREVARIAAVLAAEIHQYHIAVVAHLIVRDVVEHAGVVATGDDRRVGMPTRTVAQELMADLRFNFVLLHAGLHETAHALEGLARDRDRTLDLCHFLRRLAAADAVHDRCAALQAMQRELRARLLVLALLARLHLVALAQVLIAVEVQVLALRHQPLDRRFVARRPQYRGDPAQLRRFLLAELGAFPDRDEVARLPHEEDLAVLRVHRIGEEQQDRLLLVDAAEVEDVAGLLERHVPIGAGGHDVVAVEDGEAPFFQVLAETGAVLAVGGCGKGGVTHGSSPKARRRRSVGSRRGEGRRVPRSTSNLPTGRQVDGIRGYS